MDILFVHFLKLFSYFGVFVAQNKLGYRYLMGEGVIQDYNSAFKLFSSASNHGYKFAQANLGYMYENGMGVKKDVSKAIRLYEESAIQGHAWSQTKLGCLLIFEGNGSNSSYVEAMKWFTKAFDQGYKPGIYNVGLAYYSGKGVERDYALASKYYMQVEKYIPEARYNLALMYADGIGVEVDYEKAYKLLESAYHDGFFDAKDSMDIVKEKLNN